MRISLPGIGGSLGECPVCGNTFLKEILLGEKVSTIQLTGMDLQFCVHDKCLDVALEISNSGGDWRKLPEGPLRREFQKVATELVAK